MKKRNFLPFILLSFMLIFIVSFFVFFNRYQTDASEFNFWGFFLSSFFAMELLIFHITPPFCALLLFLISRDKNFLNSWWFRQKSWEKKFYDFIKVKKWKDSALTYGKTLYSAKNLSKEKLIFNITQSEIVHELIFLLSFYPLKLAKYFGYLPLLICLCVLCALSNLPFIFIQRFNRPRILKSDALEKSESKSKGKI